jgi:hypothetical protein
MICRVPDIQVSSALPECELGIVSAQSHRVDAESLTSIIKSGFAKICYAEIALLRGNNMRLWPNVGYRLAAVSCVCGPKLIFRVYVHYHTYQMLPCTRWWC